MSELLLKKEDEVDVLSSSGENEKMDLIRYLTSDSLESKPDSTNLTNDSYVEEKEESNITKEFRSFSKLKSKFKASKSSSVSSSSVSLKVARLSAQSSKTSKFKTSFRKSVLAPDSTAALENDASQLKSQVKVNNIRALSSESTLRICANQVITDLATAVKEVLENALDAGATRIEVKLKQYGLDGFQISDDGSGIHPQDYETIAMRHATSKLRSFDGLDQAYSQSFGFRGEALSSLCALAQVSLLTCTQEQEPLGTKLEFHVDGSIKKITSMAAKRGTTVFVSNMFENIPVRSTEFTKNAKREFAKTLELLQQYAIGCKNCRISCWHLVHSGSSSYKSNLQFATNLPIPSLEGTSSTVAPSKTLKENLISIFGSQGLSDLCEVQFTSTNSIAQLKGYISKGPSRPSSDRQFLFLHGRPVDMPKLSRCINTAYKQVYPSLAPVFAIDIYISTGFFDINVTPDKRTVFISDEENLIEEFRIFFESFFDPSSSQVVPRPLSQTTLSSFQISPEPAISSLQNDTLPTLVNELQLQTPVSQRLKKRLWSFALSQASDSSSLPISSESQKKLALSPLTSYMNKRNLNSISAKMGSTDTSHSTSHEHSASSSSSKSPTLDRFFSQPLPNPSLDSSTPLISSSSLPIAFSSSSFELSTSTRRSSVTFPHCDHAPLDNKDDIDFSKDNTLLSEEDSMDTFEGAEETLVEERVRTLTKADFQVMKIHGQFNLGFIIVSLENDVFIVDQHASDEKYRYEHLLLNVPLQQQRLLYPISLPKHLSPMDLETLSNHRDVVLEQGYQIDEHFNLISVPFIHGIALGVQHLTQVVHQLQDAVATTSNTALICNEVKAMCASKACRSSIMIGDALDLKTMQRILQNLSTLHQPWNCPHGRPTVRFLVDLQKFSMQDEASQARSKFSFSGSFFKNFTSLA